MKIALVNTIKPQAGSGDGITEVTYRLYERLRKKHDVDLVYPSERSVRTNVSGLAYANSIFRLKIGKLAHAGYDLIYISNQEMGYVAKIVKRAGTKAKVMTSIYDVMRVRKGYHRGVMQKMYNYLVAGSISDAVDYSDLIIFSAESVKRDVMREFPRIRRSKVVYIGPPHESFAKKPIPKARKGKVLHVGFVGALSHVKNAIFILKTAGLLAGKKEYYRFTVYGSGSEAETLRKYKEEKGLDNVLMPGFAPEGKLLQIYDSFDVFFYPSLEEGTSIPVFDAQARGLPVILYSKTKMSDEVLAHSLIANSERQAAEILERLRKNGYGARERTATARYARSFTWDRVSDEIIGAYKSLIQK